MQVMNNFTLHVGNCVDVLKTLDENTIDSVVTDPPYELGFMGKSWDSSGIAFSVEMWKQVLRVLKPGGHILAFSGTRTYHRMVVAMEDAGFEIRDQIGWVYGSGFPKSTNIEKTIAKSGDSATEWEGWGTALKPSWEPICLARKPLSESTIASNVLKYGTGGLNIDGCRVPTDEIITNHSRSSKSAVSKGKYGDSKAQDTHQTTGQLLGRFPANLIHDGSEEVLDLFPETNSDNSRSTARFFYCAKPSKADRGDDNSHPTVKPTELMRYLCKLITPKTGTVLDPFNGSGSTGKASILEGFKYVGIDLDSKYIDISKKRIQDAMITYEAEHNPFGGLFEIENDD